MIKYLIILLFISCTAEMPTDKTILEIPSGLMNQKEQDMTYIIIGYRDFETSMLLYNQAKVKVNQMANDNILSHSGVYDAAEQSGASYYGQGISYNYITAQENVQGFMTSEPHREMIMNPNYEKIAIACNGLYTVILVASWEGNNKKAITEIHSLSK